jgi:hypothetical protein
MSTTNLKVAGYQHPAWLPGRYCPCCTTKRHLSWYAVARCRFRRHLLWINGDPPASGVCYATVSRCRQPGTRDYITVVLHATRAAAEAAMDLIRKCGCGGSCSRLHELVVMHEDAEVDFDGE